MYLSLMMSLATFAPCAQPLRPQRGPCMYRRAAPRPSRHATAVVRAAEGAEAVASPPPEPLAASSTASADPPPAAASAADSLPPERLKQLRRDGLEIKNVIKLGRRGVADGLALQIRQRWNTSEVRAGWLRPTPPGLLAMGAAGAGHNALRCHAHHQPASPGSELLVPPVAPWLYCCRWRACTATASTQQT